MRTGFRIALLATVLTAVTGCSRAGGPGDDGPPGKRVIVIGIDGMDHALTQRLLDEGRLPALAGLAAAGNFSALGTAIPPQSPVAWSEFITGLDAGGHGIFDFLHRDPATMIPYLSTSSTAAATRTFDIGPWRIPLSGGEAELLRRGTPFWEVLEAHGVETTIVRMPANFPPSGTASRELSGMGTPDILGGYGMFTYVTTAPERAPEDLGGGGVIAPAERDGDVIRAVMRGPPNPFRVDGRTLEIPITAYVDVENPVARIEIGDEEVVLAEGEWSHWVPFEFDLGGVFGGLPGACRFLLQRTHPDFLLYVTPIQIDPLEPILPIATPADFAADLAADGRYYTQTMPEDTKAFTAGVLGPDEFLAQAALARGEAVRQYRRLLDEFLHMGGDELLFYYFGFLDMVSHVFWHGMDPEHPAHDAVRDARYAGVIEDLYVVADSIVAETLAAIGDDVTLIVMSDHGFTSWRRAFSLNAWLEEAGYLAVKETEREQRDAMDFLMNVDWSRTQAFGLGFSGLYVNIRGREATGTVPADQHRVIAEEIARRLLRLTDPATGEPAVVNVHRREQYVDRGALEIGPDLVIEYAKGVRSSDASAGGKVPAEVFSDNTSLWSGDHIMDHRAVPGVLFTNRPLTRPAANLRELGAAVLAEFGAAFPEPDSQVARKE